MIIFKNEEERQDFERTLASTSAAAVDLKLEILDGRVKLVSMGNLDAMIKQMKG